MKWKKKVVNWIDYELLGPEFENFPIIWVNDQYD